ncbi:Uncharacterised protein [Mycolicibacterium flavescens]|uniref:hypothetical protein n=1 Tax=Mycobacterium neumannii TaxID=2048551 RepID=UPI000B93D52C|nr:hypothetical protein [Mycobacterium neumannii]VEG38599.1 Uncharacterised protein [Mycolicibacterium flavescens]
MKKYSLWVFGPTVIAVAIGVLVPPAVSQAEKVWDVAEYDSCTAIYDARYELGDISYDAWVTETAGCCEESGGEWNEGAQKCEAPPATAQTAPKSPGEVVQAPRAGTAGPGQNPERTGDGTFEVVPIGPGGPVLFNP